MLQLTMKERETSLERFIAKFARKVGERLDKSSINLAVMVRDVAECTHNVILMNTLY